MCVNMNGGRPGGVVLFINSESCWPWLCCVLLPDYPQVHSGSFVCCFLGDNNIGIWQSGHRFFFVFLGVSNNK